MNSKDMNSSLKPKFEREKRGKENTKKKKIKWEERVWAETLEIRPI
jgi:hypothetical protein